ncbi:MAG TPA: nuclear transport factor 2 family protein [Bryobacteraceae bacterium]
MSGTAESVTALLAKYNEALNASSTDAVMQIYAEDGVFMPPYSQSAVGSAAVRKAYDAVFKAITLNVKFTIAEIVELGAGGLSRARIPAARRPIMRRDERARKATRSCSSLSRIMMAPGKSRATVSR